VIFVNYRVLFCLIRLVRIYCSEIEVVNDKMVNDEAEVKRPADL
jgi:hypothetical protein